MKKSRQTVCDSFLTAYDLDQLSGMPPALRLRTLHLLALFVGVLSICATLEWPRAWQLVALGDVAATSFLFALAAAREWFLRYRLHQELSRSRLATAGRSRLELQTVVS